MNFENRPTNYVRPYSGNARTHSPKQIKQISRSIERFGFNNPVLVDDDLLREPSHQASKSSWSPRKPSVVSRLRPEAISVIRSRRLREQRASATHRARGLGSRNAPSRPAADKQGKAYATTIMDMTRLASSGSRS